MVHTHQGYEHHTRKRVRVSDDSLPRPGFKSAAVYFEWLAQKETRDYDRQQRLLEVAGFYRSLAGIIPAMPTQYKIKVGPSLTRAERWHARAEECRTLAPAARSDRRKISAEKRRNQFRGETPKPRMAGGEVPIKHGSSDGG